MQTRKRMERGQFSVRLGESERKLADQLAAHYGHTVSGLFRFLLNEKARELGYAPASPPPRSLRPPPPRKSRKPSR